MTETEVLGVPFITKPFEDMPRGFVSMFWSTAYGDLAAGIQRYYEQFSEWPAEVYELERLNATVWFLGSLHHEPWLVFASIDDLAQALPEID